LMLRTDDRQFKALIDEMLAQLMRSGEFERLYVRWFEQPIPPRGINIQLPMSEALKQAVEHSDWEPGASSAGFFFGSVPSGAGPLSRSVYLAEHDLFRKRVPTFRDHALLQRPGFAQHRLELRRVLFVQHAHGPSRRADRTPEKLQPGM